MKPVASSHQLRIFGAYTRRLPEGMKRVQATSSHPDLLATAFRGEEGRKTVILLNRSTEEQRIAVKWPGAEFRYAETASPGQENSAEPVARAASGQWEVVVKAGSIVTLTNVELGKVASRV
jgi:hypothetical protein